MFYHQQTSSTRPLLIFLSLVLCFLHISVHAKPVGPDFPPIISKDSFPSFEDCRNKLISPGKDKAMYFTGLSSFKDVKKAKQYAISHGLTHVTASYPNKFTDKGQYEGDEAQFRQFQKDFSRAYAQKTEGVAYLMLDDGKEPAEESIFYSVEFEAMKKGGHVDKIIRFSFTDRDNVAEPTKETKIYWEKPDGSPSYASGQCGVHITHYQIPKGDNKYYLEAQLKDAYGFEVGHVDKTDATEPVNVLSALPHPLVITAAKPGSSKDPDSAPLHFAYGDDEWTSDDDRCKFGGYEDGNREGDCGFAC